MMQLDNTDDFDIETILVNDLIGEITKNLDKNIQYAIFKGIRQEQGWTTIKLSRFQDNEHAVDITYWLAEQGLMDGHDYYRDGAEFVFESKKIAALFALKWMA